MLKYLKLFTDVVVAIPIAIFIASFILLLLTALTGAFSMPAILVALFLFKFLNIPESYNIYAVIGLVIFHGIVILLIGIKYHFEPNEQCYWSCNSRHRHTW